MGINSKIEWTDHTFNPWWGCVRVSPACEHCYAETFAKRVGQKVWGVQAERRFFGDKHWAEPLKWNARAAALGERHRVFCASMADVFEERDDLVAPRERLFRLIIETPHLDWLLLTKRPGRIRHVVPDTWRLRMPANIWMGTTVEDQKRAEERVEHLLDSPAVVRFLSCEPLLGPIDLENIEPYYIRDSRKGGPPHPYDPVIRLDALRHHFKGPDELHENPINWVIAGGESGHGARPMNPEWVRSLRDQCERAGVAFLFKQWGEHDDGLVRIGKKKAGRLLDGREWNGLPAVAP